jgi:hypothetical protein
LLRWDCLSEREKTKPANDTVIIAYATLSVLYIVELRQKSGAHTG